MSISDKLSKLNTDITNAYASVQTKGGTVPTNKNTENLASAINSISGGDSSGQYVWAKYSAWDGSNGTLEGYVVSDNEDTYPNNDYGDDGYYYLMGFTDDTTEMLDKFILLEYIEGTGTQYIDTGFIPNQNTRVVIDFQYTSTTSAGRLFGCRNTVSTDNNTQCFAVGTYGRTPPLAYYTAYNANTYSFGAIDLERHVIDFNKNVLSYDGEIVNTFSTGNFTGYGNIFIFTFNNQTVANMALARVFSCKIYDNGTLVRDLVPCYRESDNECGLYDVLNKVFYVNKGTGSFNAGQIVG